MRSPLGSPSRGNRPNPAGGEWRRVGNDLETGSGFVLRVLQTVRLRREFHVADMSLTRKTFLAMTLTMISLLAIVGVLVGSLVTAGFQRIEHEEARKDALRARDALQQMVTTTDTKCQDWSHWDDLWSFMRTKDKGFAAGNLMDEVTDTLKIDLMVVVDVKGELLFYSDTDFRSGVSAASRAQRARLVRNSLPGILDGKLAKGLAGVALLDSKPVIFTSQPIFKTNGEGDNRGVVLMACKLDGRTVRELADTTHQSIRCTSISPDARLADRTIQKLVTGPAGVLVTARDAEVRSYCKVLDPQGKPVVVLTVTAPRTVYLQGRRTVVLALGGIAVVGLFLGLVGWLALRKVVLARLARLSSQVSRIGSGTDGIARVDVGPPDELGLLARLTNEMLDSKEKQSDELKLAHEELISLMSSVPFALILFDAEGWILTGNSVAKRIFPGAGCKHKRCSLWNLPFDWDKTTLSALLAERPPTGDALFSADVKMASGPSAGIYEVVVAPVESSPGSDHRYLLSAVEVTQQYALRSQLAQKQKLESIGQLAAGIAHEINTPAQYVSDNVHFLKGATATLIQVVRHSTELTRDAAETGNVREAVTKLEAMLVDEDVAYLADEIPAALAQTAEGLARMSAIVGAIKDFAHPDVDGQSPSDLNRAVESTVAVSRNQWKYVAELELQLQPDLPRTTCNVGEINQVVLNLIVNAVHAIEDAGGDEGGMGKITVQTRTLADDQIEISVSDTGPGIPEQIQSKIFDPFFTTKDVGKGTGQGLAIAHNVVVNHHRGTLDFQTRPGQGTTFRILLPIGGANSPAKEDAA
jgi:signal transduction histidine kinase/sensor domain CHASE-containing protein